MEAVIPLTFQGYEQSFRLNYRRGNLDHGGYRPRLSGLGHNAKRTMS